MIMPSHHEKAMKNKTFLLRNNNGFSMPNAQGDDNDDDDNYLVPQFDSEIMDLDEDKMTDDDQELNILHREQKCIRNNRNLEHSYKQTLNPDNCTIIGTNCLGKKIPYLIFSVEAVLRRDATIRKIGEKYNLTYKVYKTDCKLLKTILNSHGFQECQSYSNDYNLLWTGGHVRPYNLRTMGEFQKINHFPRSYELTRKDRLFKNIQKMQQLKGLKHFDFVPPSYLIPSEFQELCHNFAKEKSTFIVKPIALSRGRGIFLSNHPSQIPLDEQLIASRYISNPYLINDLKFDVRMYVLVTSFDPLVAYLYEEGLTRFATVRYQNVPKNIKSLCMHLTNYSLNKKNNDFIHNDDADVEDHGNKWSLGALLRYLKGKNVDTTGLMMKVEDIIIKSLIAVEAPISATCRMFQSYRSNCFELYGYDIIIDENLRPWLLEVNLSPSLSCDSPLDFKIKSHMMSDMFSLIGIGCEDPMLSNPNQQYVNSKTKSSLNQSYPTGDNKIPKQINNQNSSIRRPTAGLRRRDLFTNMTPFKSDQLRMVRRVKEEFRRKGGWIRIFPTIESLETYFPFFQSSKAEQNNMNTVLGNQMNLNRLLYFKLFPNHSLESETLNRTSTQNQANYKTRVSLHSVNYNASFHNGTLSQLLPSSQGIYTRISQNYNDTQSRIPYYERKLGEDPLVVENFEKKSDFKAMARDKSNMMDINYLSNHDSENELVSSNSSISISDKEDGLENSDSDIDVDDDDLTSTNSHNIPSSMSQPSKEVLSIEKLVNLGGKLTKIQARMAFSSYLTKVQQRLMVESRSKESNIVTNEDNNCHEQLELVLRFLKRAASNMSPEEFVIPPIPERSQPLSQRQEWLAKLLGNFIGIYSRETSIADAKQTDSPTNIDKKTFLSFLRLASENDLEQTLSNYTRVNKSAGIFLNPNLNSRNSLSPVAIVTADKLILRPPSAGLHKSASMNNLSMKDKSSPEKGLKCQQPINKPLTTKTQSTLQINQRPISVDQQSFSRPTSVNQSPWRPGSTKLVNNNHRPLTSSLVNNRTKIANKTEKSYDPDAIAKALQRLAVDQRTRQLTGSGFSFYDANIGQQNTRKRSTNFDPLTETLMRQYQQSKQLLHDSRAKHNALLLQNSEHPANNNNNNNSSNNNNNNNNKSQLVNKPPPGIRSSQTVKLPCTMRK